MNQNELETLCRIAEAAGQEIMAVYRDGGEAWQKDDQSPLTEADLRADRVIRQELIKRTPTLVERFFKPNRPLALTQQAKLKGHPL